MNQNQTEVLNSLDTLSPLEAFKSKLSPKLMGATFMLLWALTFSTAMAFAKTLSPEVDSVIVLFMRYFFGLVFFSPFIMRAGTKGFTTSRPVLHLIRVTTLGIAVALHLFRLSKFTSGSCDVYWDDGSIIYNCFGHASLKR